VPRFADSSSSSRSQALEASLGRIDELEVEALYCGGDLVGYGPHSNEVCDLIAQRGIPTIYGNYDYAIARNLDDCGCAYVDKHDREIGQLSVAWTLAHTIERVAYDAEAVAAEIRAVGLPEELARKLPLAA
jgi:hypothetical protein